jgi:hypothetical protein
MNKAAKIIAAGIGTVALAGAVGAGLAYADPDPTPTVNPSATPSASPTDKADRKDKADGRDKADRKEKADKDRRHPGLLRRALHGEVTLRGEKHRVVVFQRGVVETVNATTITVKSEDGFTGSYLLNAETRVRKEKQEATLSDIKPKDRVRVLATKDGSTLTAKGIRDHGA